MEKYKEKHKNTERVGKGPRASATRGHSVFCALCSGLLCGPRLKATYILTYVHVCIWSTIYCFPSVCEIQMRLGRDSKPRLSAYLYPILSCCRLKLLEMLTWLCLGYQSVMVKRMRGKLATWRWLCYKLLARSRLDISMIWNYGYGLEYIQVTQFISDLWKKMFYNFCFKYKFNTWFCWILHNFQWHNTSYKKCYYYVFVYIKYHWILWENNDK